MSELREVTLDGGIVTGPGRGIGHEYALMRPNVRRQIPHVRSCRLSGPSAAASTVKRCGRNRAGRPPSAVLGEDPPDTPRKSTIVAAETSPGCQVTGTSLL